MKQISLAIVGAGSRGLGVYAPYALRAPEKVKIVAAADPDPVRRQRAREIFDIPQNNLFESWEAFTAVPKMADAAVIATQDQMHVEPTVACAERGYHILLEKPMATTEKGCLKIIEAVRRNKVIFALGFVLRYSSFYKKLKELLASQVIGRLVTFRHLEQVGYWHHAHSFVRGNWRNSKESCPMLLAKCCHDLDILNFLTGKKCLALSSYGELTYFKPENRPAGATARCLDCPYRDSCIYSAFKFYFGKLHRNELDWPLDVITHDMTETGVTTVLRNGPYGRCVFDCDNDAVDHQTVNFRYDDGISGTLTMTAFGERSARRIELYGTHGQIIGDGACITVTPFGTGQSTIYPVNSLPQDFTGGHGGGDTGLIAAFVDAVAQNDQSILGANLDGIIASHRMAFAAEASRSTGAKMEL